MDHEHHHAPGSATAGIWRVRGRATVRTHQDEVQE